MTRIAIRRYSIPARKALEPRRFIRWGRSHNEAWARLPDGWQVDRTAATYRIQQPWAWLTGQKARTVYAILGAYGLVAATLWAAWMWYQWHATR